MEKEEFFTEDNLSFLNQIVSSLEEAEGKLENYYSKKDSENLNRVKKFMTELIKKMSEAL